MYRLSVEVPDDFWEIEALYDTCFAPGREALSSYRFRDGVPSVAQLNHVARDTDGLLAGAIRFWPVRIGQTQALLLGPVAVHPTRQGEGLGGMLIEGALEKAAPLGWARVLLVGDAPYYRRFGFHKLSAVQMPAPTNPDRVLGRTLRPDGWTAVSGVVRPWVEGD